MVTPERLALAKRLKEARLHAAAARGEEITKEEMGPMISPILGRAIHATQWRRYESGRSEPPLDVIRAVATLSGLSEAYIAFGEREPEPPAEEVTDVPIRRERLLSEDELPRADDDRTDTGLDGQTGKRRGA